jgi:hypothetical protein
LINCDKAHYKKMSFAERDMRLNSTTIHPFPARMAPEITYDVLDRFRGKAISVLDPMAGSGTTLIAAKSRGFEAIGFDSDPLSVMLTSAWVCSFSRHDLFVAANRIINKARLLYELGTGCPQYPSEADAETRAFIRFWFDKNNRRQLSALSIFIKDEVRDDIRNLLWCALSRLIIAKKNGASIAADISHSRPHRDLNKKCLRPIDLFERSVQEVARRAPFADRPASGLEPKITLGDARNLPLMKDSVDLILTSPPYLNAIDYLRGHKFSLVWMGWSIGDIRLVRSKLIGSEVGLLELQPRSCLWKARNSLGAINLLGRPYLSIVNRFVQDMELVMSEINRVLRRSGSAIIVIGESQLKGIRLRNARMLKVLAEESGLSCINLRRRKLLPNKRYLPPPNSVLTKNRLSERMSYEIIMEFIKAN